MSDRRRPEGAAPRPAQVKAWDGPTRLFHWGLVLLIALAWVSRSYGDEGLRWHTLNGYAVLVLIVWRILWGFFGSSTSRFRRFLLGPLAAAGYGLDVVRKRSRHFLGHNPLGGLMVMALIALVGVIGFTGLFSYDDHDGNVGGPLSGKVADATWALATRLHMKLFDVLLALVVLHVVAALVYLVWKRENLVRAMVTGLKPARRYEDQPEAQIASIARALVCLIAAALLVLGGIMTAGGRLL